MIEGILVDAIQVTSFPDALTAGAIVRLAMVSRAVFEAIFKHPILWKAIAAQALEWKSAVSVGPEQVLHSLRTTQRCKECGATASILCNLDEARTIRLCTPCSRDGYRKLVNRAQILRLIHWLDWKPRNVQQVTNHIVLVKRSIPNGMHMYWATDVAKRLNQIRAKSGIAPIQQIRW